MFALIDILAAVPAAESEGVVGDITRSFKVYWPQLVSQFISFAIVILLLRIFAFKPIQQMLEQRRERISAGEEKLKRIEKQLADSEATTAAAIAKANEDALRLVAEAKQGAAAFTEQKAQEAIAQAQQILSKAEAAAKADRERIAAELKREFGRLVADTTSQVTGKVLTSDDQHRINAEALAKVGN
ncbi:MAG: ATP synthase F0 subunit B [Verrucomicrobiota bacterium]